MLLLALFGVSAVVAIRLYPGPIAILFCLLTAAGCIVPLRARALTSTVLAAVAVAALVLGRLSSEVMDSAVFGTAARDASLWGGIAAGSALLLGSTLLAVGTSRALAMPAASPARRQAGPGIESPRTVVSAEAGLQRVEWELARAAHYRRQLTLCLLGLDERGAGEQPSEPASRMRRVDRFLLHELSRFEVVAERGTERRLLVLPEVWADGFGEEAERLCRLAGRRAGRPVRSAMVTFPFHGTRIADLLNELELALDRCRSVDQPISVGVPVRGKQVSPPTPSPQSDAVDGSLPLAGRVGRGSSDQARESGQASGFAS
jgi:hypothetical protein